MWLMIEKHDNRNLPASNIPQKWLSTCFVLFEAHVDWQPEQTKDMVELDCSWFADI